MPVKLGENDLHGHLTDEGLRYATNDPMDTSGVDTQVSTSKPWRKRWL